MLARLLVKGSACIRAYISQGNLAGNRMRWTPVLHSQHVTRTHCSTKPHSTDPHLHAYCNTLPHRHMQPIPSSPLCISRN